MRAPLSVLSLVLASSLSLIACRDDSIVAPVRHAPSSPNAVLLGNPIMNITAGQYHTCIRRYRGTTYCWGFDADGQLGIGAAPAMCGTVGVGYPYGSPPYPCASVPTLIPNFAFGAVSAGTNQTCAIRGYDRTAWCWGNNAWFQLGTGDHSSSATPVQVAGTSAFSSIAAGFLQSCGTVDGAFPQGSLFCWGHDLTSGAVLRSPMDMGAPASDPANFHGVSAGGGAACAYWSDGVTPKLYCVGENDYGQAGVAPAAAVPLSQVPVAPAAPPALASQFGCVDEAAGGVACWGLGYTTALDGWGNAYVTSATPVEQQFAYKQIGPFGGVYVVASGPLHGVVAAGMYACALDASGNAWCWGQHSFDGTSSSYGTMVGGGHTFAALAAGFQHVCGIGTDQHVWCWGDNNVGQLGNGMPGTSAPATQPVLASGT